MSPPICERLELLVDGELEPAEEQDMRLHLSACPACQARLPELVYLEMMAAAACAGQKAVRERSEQPPPAARHKVRWAVAAGMALAAAVAALLLLAPGQAPEEPWLTQVTVRQLEARLSYPAADRYRPYEPMRSAGSSSRALPLEPLARLEEQGALAGVAAAFILHEEYGQAAAYLERMPPSAGRASDLAVVALQRGEPEQALRLLEPTLEAQPPLPQAQWNRALALRELGLQQEAEEALLEVAGLGEPGWSEEARQRAQALHRLRQAQRAAVRKEVEAVLARLGQPGEASVPAQALAQPESARLALYEAARSATSSSQVLALLPLAEALDRLQGDTILASYVRGVAARDLSRRAALAREYARLARGELADPSSLLERLRREGEQDLLLGALLRLGSPLEWEPLAREHPEPRLHLLAERERARRERAAGLRSMADQRLLEVARSCKALALGSGCAENPLQ